MSAPRPASCRLPANTYSQGVPAPLAASSTGEAALSFALSDQALVLTRLIAAHHRESLDEALARAVAFYADHAIGIAALARKVLPCEAGEGDHAQHGGGGAAFARERGAPPSSGCAGHFPRERGEIGSADAQAPP